MRDKPGCLGRNGSVLYRTEYRMAIDKAKTRDLIAEINAVFDAAASGWSEEKKEWLKENIMSAAFEELDKLVRESRPPVLYVMGRSGHGKSSLINALAGREVAEVGHIKPQTVGADPYHVSFPEVYAEWEIIDSRGIFETTTPEGAPQKDALAQVKEDIKKHRPDVILHVIAAPETRTLQNDFKAFAEVQKVAEQELGFRVPSIMAINKVDVLGNPRDWPLEEYANKAGHVKDLLDYVTKEVLGGSREKMDLNSSIKGYNMDEGHYVCVVPVCAREKSDEWNVDTLSLLIGERLPKDAQLDFYQAQQRKELLRRVSTSIIKRFSTISGGIGTAPFPIVDIAVLVPLQLLMVALISGLSCRPFSRNSVAEFAAATGVTLGATFGVRQLARQLVRFVPIVGLPTSGAIAYANTFGIGKSAEAYFFYGETRKPKAFVQE